jgi:putative aminopeptidase
MTLDVDLLRALCLAPGPSGEEQAVADLLDERFTALGLTTHRDRIGNLWTTIGTGRPSIAVLAHMDEVGLVVRRIDPDGFIHVVRLGGIGRRSLAARRITFLGRHGPVPGIVGVKSHHLTDPADAQRIPSVDEAYVDVGATSHEEVRALGVDVGTKAVFTGGFDRLAGGRVTSKALDDRAGCLLLAELAARFAEAPPDRAVSLVATVREEFDVQGAVHAVRALRPDVCVIVDVTPAADPPDLAGHHDVVLGEGPALKLFDFHGRGPLAGYIAARSTADLVGDVADDIGVPLQREALVGLVTDASALVAADGPPALICLSLPVRYTHSPVEVCDLRDLANLIGLVAGVVRSAGADLTAPDDPTDIRPAEADVPSIEEETQQ